MTALATATKGRLGVIAAVVLSGLLVSMLLLRVSEAGFSATTGNSANSWQTGSVTLTDNDGGSALFSATALDGGQAVVKCINVTYAGTFTSGVNVKMFGTAISGDLAPYLDTVIEEGTGATDTACTGFTGGSAIYTGTLANFGTTHGAYASGVGTWAPNGAPQTRSYKITTTVRNDNAAQGKTAAATFNWEAQHN